MNRRDEALRLALRYPGGIDALAGRMSKRPDTLRKELTGVHGYKFGVDEEELLIALCIGARVLDPLAPITAAAVNAGAMVIPLPVALDEGSSSFAVLAETAKEFGEFMASVAESAADGRISANEIKRIERESGDLVSRVQACVAHMHAMHEGSKPSHLRAA